MPELSDVSGGQTQPKNGKMSLEGYSTGRAPLQEGARNGLTLSRQIIYVLSAVLV